MEYSYRGWKVYRSKLGRCWYGWDPNQHIAKTKITATSQEQILRMVEDQTPNYKAPVFAWMAA